MPFNWGLLFLVIATSGVVLGISAAAMYFLNKEIDGTNR